MQQTERELRGEVAENRSPEYDVDPLSVNRWSPRSVTGESLPEEDRVHEELDAPEEFDVEAMFAVGERAPTSELPEELQEREQPSGRKDFDEIVRRGSFE